MHTVPLIVALLTSSQPMGSAAPATYRELCVAFNNHEHATCALVLNDNDASDGDVTFFVDKRVYIEFLVTPWLAERFSRVTVNQLDTEDYNVRREMSTTGGILFDFRSISGRRVEISSWGWAARTHSLPSSFTIDQHWGHVVLADGSRETPTMFVNYHLMASGECTAGVLGGFINGALAGGGAGAAGGAAIGACTVLGALPGALALGVLGGAAGAVGGALEAAADHCYKDEDKKEEQEEEETDDDADDDADDADDADDDSEDDDSGDDGGEDEGDDPPTDDDDGTPDPSDGDVTDDSEEMVETLGLGYPHLSPTAKIDSLINPHEQPRATSYVRLSRPVKSPQDWLILHDGKRIELPPVDIVSIMNDPIVPVTPADLSRWSWRW